MAFFAKLFNWLPKPVEVESVKVVECSYFVAKPRKRTREVLLRDAMVQTQSNTVSRQSKSVQTDYVPLKDVSVVEVGFTTKPAKVGWQNEQIEFKTQFAAKLPE